MKEGYALHLAGKWHFDQTFLINLSHLVGEIYIITPMRCVFLLI